MAQVWLRPFTVLPSLVDFSQSRRRMAYYPDPNLKGFLDPNDPVATSFWIISIAMVAATVFFLMESMAVGLHWKTSMNVGALVTLVAAVHYFYMREFWVQLGTSPIVYRYIDWSITVPLQMIEFYLILFACNDQVGGGMFWRLLIGTIVMLGAGYCGEAGYQDPKMSFYVGMVGWAFILAEVFVVTRARGLLKKSVTPPVNTAYNAMSFIVTVGWTIYPAGYYFGH